MNKLFGIPMNDIMVALLILLGVALGSVVWVFLRNRVMFLIGVRNIPRRRAQTTLIVVGLMLSTLIISAAFSIGDTVNYSITNQGYETLHSVDELVQTNLPDNSGGGGGDLGVGASRSALPIPQDRADQLVARFKQLDGVDGALSVIEGTVPVVDARSGQSERGATVMGVDPANMKAFPDVESKGGTQLSLNDLGPGEIYMNSSLADELDAQAGDNVTVFVGGKPSQLTVKEIVKDRGLTGSAFGTPNGFVMPLPAAQTLLNRTGEVDAIAVSNDGGVHDGIGLSDKVTDELNSTLQEQGATQWKAEHTKQSLVDDASTAASFLTTFFVILGLFSIAAGMLLIFLIFVMLAAERKVEMGMTRAIGTKRSHLTQMFLSEGMAYNVLAAAVGAGLGIAVSLAMVQVMAWLFSSFNLSIVFHVTARSLIVSYSLGVVLTFLTVTFSSWRIGALNIVSAIRDIDDPTVQEQRPITNGGVRGALTFVRWTFFKPSSFRQVLRAIGMIAVAILFGIATGVLATIAVRLGTDTLAAGAGAVLLMVLAFSLGAVALVALVIGLNSIFQPAPPLLAAGVVFAIVGVATSQAFPWMLGITLVIVALALFAHAFGLPSRPAFTTMGVLLVVYWLLGAADQLPFPPHNLNGGFEMFFLSGVAMVTATTFVLIYNADLLLSLLALSGGAFSRLVPSIKTAVAYPLANKFRTGMTISMISLVVFALVMMATMNANFNRVFSSEGALGGYQVRVVQNPSNQISDLKGALQQGGFDTSSITQVDSVDVANEGTSLHQVGQPTTGDKQGFDGYAVYGMSGSFMRNNGLELQARATGYSSDEAVWQSVQQHPDQAVIDAAALSDSGGGGFGGGGFTLSGVKSKDKTFDPITIQVKDAATGNTRSVQVVGIIATKASELFHGLFIPAQTFDEVYGQPLTTVDYVKLAPGTNARTEARGIEKSLLEQGVQADSLRKIIDDNQQLSQGFSYLIQGFLGLGLFVGIAAVGVIAFRTVVERRQQIGMLRAIGYTRAAVAISFVMESSFIALLGVLSGILLALLLAKQLLGSPGFEGSGITGFYVPWIEVVGIGLFAFLASLLMTIIPSRQASSIPIAEALRYE
ncbi:MAG TPA: FtsX-like permease family protein [Dehalococcoidia bacterium]|nr:FtsX-like permease family protein [Dehalococcoidia bacterium]